MSELSGDMSMMLLTALVTGAFSSVATVIALKVHVDYLRASIGRLDLSVARAHKRIDGIVKA
jgi:hypothetical protein